MPVLKSDADRAREILQDYHSRLTEPSDKSLRKSIERLTHIFTSDLFKALLDIQEYYEVTLQNEGKSESERNQEWMSRHGFSTDTRLQRPDMDEPVSGPVPARPMMAAPPHTVEVTLADLPRPSKAPPPPPAAAPDAQVPYQGMVVEAGPDLGPDPAQPAIWDEEVILLHRGETGFGFSIAGGVDNPHIENDPSIYVTRVVPGGVAAVDGRLQLDDMIVAVNSVDVTAVNHDDAVAALKNAGASLELVVRRPRGVDGPGGAPVPMDGMAAEMGDLSLQPQAQPAYVEIELWKQGRGLGFSIAGGVGSEHIDGDPGIFVTRVIDNGCAYADGRMAVGDRLVMVDDDSLENVTHEDAVTILKGTGEQVRLLLLKSPPIEMEGDPMMQGQMYANMGPGPGVNVHVGAGDSSEKGKKGFGLFKKKKR